MGASNALAVFRLYASKVPPTSMNVLAYMALVSLDSDTEPWFSLGAEAIAVMALGREPLSETGDAKEDAKARKAMEVACERALRPLFAAGAITTDRHSSGHPGKVRHARYRLWLTAPASGEARGPRRSAGQAAPYGKRGVQNSDGVTAGDAGGDGAPYGKHREPDPGTLRNLCRHPTETVPAPYEIRRAKEYEEYEERRENLEEHSSSSSNSVPVRAREAPDEPDGLASIHVIPSSPAAASRSDRSRCRDAWCDGRSGPVEADGYHETCRNLARFRPRVSPVIHEPSRYTAQEIEDHS